MSDTRDRLAEILHKQGAYCGTCDYESRDCPDCASVLEGYATAILAEFLVIPRTDITTEYGYRHRVRGRSQWCEDHLVRDLEHALRGADIERDDYSEAEPTQRPVLPWSPIPLPENGQQQ